MRVSDSTKANARFVGLSGAGNAPAAFPFASAAPTAGISKSLPRGGRTRTRSLRALAFLALATATCGGCRDAHAGLVEPVDPRNSASPASGGPRLFAGPQWTCVAGRDVACAGAAEFLAPDTTADLAAARSVAFGLRHGCRIIAFDRDARALRALAQRSVGPAVGFGR